MSNQDCGECGARWHSPCEPCAMTIRRNNLFAAYGIPTEPDGADVRMPT